MGRGLSLHQKKILSFVLKERYARCEDLLSLWGVQPGAVVDKARYAAAHSALSRSLTRLYLRNLIALWQDKLTHYRTAVTLTEAGKSMAEGIILEEEEETS